MDHPLLKSLSARGHYSEEELLLLQKELGTVNSRQGAFLLKEGDICSSVWYLGQGAVEQYKIDDDLEKNTIDLYVPGDWVMNHKSFSSRKPSESFLKVTEDATFYELTIESIHRLIAQSQSFLQMGTILEASTSRLIFFDNKATPAEKYEYVMEQKPSLLQQFSQKTVASYLKITPETLSRVRNKYLK